MKGAAAAILAGVLGGLVAAAPASAQSAYEAQVLAEVNFARTDPAGYAAMLERYKAFFKGNIVSLPGQPADFETSEGVQVVDETIAFLKKQVPLPPIAAAQVLREGALEHTTEQGKSGATGHAGADGSSPGDRVKRHGGGPYVAEVIAYGPFDPVDAVRQLIVDDGVSDRGHRTILYSPELVYAGVACGPHKDFRTMCTIDLGMTAEGRLPGATRQAAVRRDPRPVLSRAETRSPRRSPFRLALGRLFARG